MKKISVVFIVPSLIKSGPINVVYNIVKNLARDRFTAIIAYLSEHPLKERNNQGAFEELGIKVIPHHFSKWQLQFQTRDIARYLQEELDGPDVIFHAHGYYPTLLLAHMPNVQTLTTVHNRCGEDFRMKKGFLLGSYMAYNYLRALPRLSAFVPVCHSMKDYYLQRIPRRADKAAQTSATVIPNGVTTPAPLPTNKKTDMRTKLAIHADAPILLYPAGFTKGKNQQRIIKELMHSPRDFVVLFAGQGSLEQSCREMVSTDNRFRFLGFQMDLSALWSASDFLISPSLSEGMPMAVLEALTRGIPCILSDIAAHQELVDSIPGSGICFPLNKEGALRRAFEKALATKFDHNAIRNKAIELYSAQTMCSGYEALYQQLYDKSQHIKA